MAAEAPSLARAARDAQARPVIGQSARAMPGSSAPPQAPAPGSAEAATDERARFDYLLHCSGCHGADGAPHRIGRIPPLKDMLGRFLQLPEGRTFLVQVPGVHNSGLDDAAVARVMNWMVPRFSAATLPAGGFVPYTAAEVGEARAHRPADVPTYRKTLARRLAEAGHPVDY